MTHPISLEAQPWWDALAQARLQAQRCVPCGQLRHYPSPMCPHCQSMVHDWVPLSGRGSVHSWTVTHQTALPAFRERVPYALVTVDLAEGVRMLAPLTATSLAELRVGLPVRAVFEARADGTLMPTFTRD